MKRKLILFVALVLCGLNIQAQSFSGHQVAAEGAWCWFADPRAIHYENASGTINMSYVGYIDVHGAVKATQYNWLTGEKSDVLVRSYFQPDDHNNPTFLVLPDERVLIIYSRHTDEPAFYYRVSLKPGDITQLGEEKCLATANNTTYPSPFIMSDDPTHWYLCWRGIGWHPTIARLTLPDEKGDCKFDWGPYQMVQSTGARPYAKYYSNGKDKLYVTYTTGHPDNESPNWIYFNVININPNKVAAGEALGQPVLEDIKGNRLSTIANGKFNVNKTDSYKSSYPYTVVDAPSNGIRDWVWQIALDKQQRPRIAMVRINSAKSQHEYYYARWTGSSWALTDICDGGAKFHPSNTEYCYSGGEALDQQNPNIMYVSKPTPGTYGNVFEIWKYTLSDNGVVQGSEQITMNSEKNNVRPFILANSEGSPLRLTWMNGDYQYWIVSASYPKGYPTGIMCDYEWKAPAAAQPDGWTYSKQIVMDSENYSGLLLKSGYISYSLSATTHKPEISIGSKTYTSSNQLYTSDAWQTNSATTNGKSYPSMLTTWNLTISYNAATKQLTTYRNGLIDQIIDIPESDAAAIGAAPEGATALQSQQQIQAQLKKEILNTIALPAVVQTDLVLPSKLNGESITWTSSDEKIIDSNGIFFSPSKVTELTLTARIGDTERVFNLTAMPRQIGNNLLAHYDFKQANVSGKTVKDLSGRGNDLTLMGSAKANGVLDLTSNTAAGFSTNGYGVVAPAVMDSLRSYTILFTATPKRLDKAPRFYDFGFSSGNSLFCRANTFTAGIKYAGGSTTMTSSTTQLTAGQTYKIAVTYNASTKITTIYLDGKVVGSGTENINEAYMIALSGACTRNYIGRTQWWDSSVAADNADFCGSIDDFSIYNTTLTEKEILKLQDIPFEEKEYKTSFDNGDFEDQYSVLSGSGVSNDRAIYVPNGWTVDYSTRNNNDLTALRDGDLYYSQFFAGKAQNTEGGKQTMWIRQRWGASVIGYYQEVQLAAGQYELSVDLFASDTSAETYVYVDGTQQRVSQPNTWQTVTFNLTANGEEAFKIGLQSSHVDADGERISGFDNFVLTKLPDDEPDAIAPLLQGKAATATYDLTGRRTNGTRRGIFLKQGKKYVIAR